MTLKIVVTVPPGIVERPFPEERGAFLCRVMAGHRFGSPAEVICRGREEKSLFRRTKLVLCSDLHRIGKMDNRMLGK